MTLPTTAGARTFGVILTVADHEQNGFIALARWPALTEDQARGFIEAVDESVSAEAEPDNATAAFAFILDLTQGQDTIDNGRRMLPLQVAMSLAPEQVQTWLNERPDPDGVAMSARRIPLGPSAALTTPGCDAIQHREGV